MAKILSSSGSLGISSNGTKVTPPYGKGARSYGGSFVQGRVNQNQAKIQNTGYTPSEDYRPAPYLPELWKDLDANGCPFTIEMGTILGVAGVADGGNERVDAHFVAPANAGIEQNIVYTADDLNIAVNIDAQDPTAAALVKTAVTTAATASKELIGNKPLAFAPVSMMSSAWELRFANQRYDHQATLQTSDLVMYPVADGFMYGGSLGAASTDSDEIATFGAEGAPVTSGYCGVASHTMTSATYALAGIHAGDKVMPNPYLPGRLISVDDFVTLVLTDDLLGAKVQANAGLAGLPTYADALAYAMQHVVGTCFKRQSRMSYDVSETAYVGHDIYSDSYRYYSSVEEFGLAGTDTDGVEADQIVASQFAKAAGDALSADFGVDVVFINFNVK